jgi:hypothetical protein
VVTANGEERVKSREEIMEILEAFDLTRSCRDAGELAGCSHHTVAVTLARLHGVDRMDWALGHAATFGRFGDGDLASILAAHPTTQRRTASESYSLQTGTNAWDGFGR